VTSPGNLHTDCMLSTACVPTACVPTARGGRWWIYIRRYAQRTRALVDMLLSAGVRAKALALTHDYFFVEADAV